MRYLLPSLLALLSLSHLAIGQEGKVITKSITIINGDTIVEEQVLDLDASDYKDYYSPIDSLPNILEQLGIDSIVKDGMTQIRMQVESFNFDSLALDLHDQAIHIEHFFQDLKLDSVLSNVFGQVQELELGDIMGDDASTVSDKIGESLNQDGLLLPERNNTIELTGKTLKINGEKQPTNIHSKYKRIWEYETGTTLQGKDRISLDIMGQDMYRTIQRD